MGTAGIGYCHGIVGNLWCKSSRFNRQYFTYLLLYWPSGLTTWRRFILISTCHLVVVTPRLNSPSHNNRYPAVPSPDQRVSVHPFVCRHLAALGGLFVRNSHMYIHIYRHSPLPILTAKVSLQLTRRPNRDRTAGRPSRPWRTDRQTGIYWFGRVLSRTSGLPYTTLWDRFVH